MPPITFTVIVPTYRRPTALARCLACLEAQTYPKSAYDVIVVDDAATPGVSAPIVQHIHSVSCRLVTQNHCGPAAARNRGAANATGKFLAFTDDDCRPAPDWLTCIEQHVTQPGSPVIVGGKVINALQQNPYASATQALIDFLYENLNRDPQHAQLLTSNNLCIPTNAFRELGGFSVAFTGAGGEDRELCLRSIHSGYRLVYAPEALVHHEHEMSLLGYARQHHAYGRGACVLRRCALCQGHGRLELESVSFYLALLSHPLRSSQIEQRALNSILFLLSQLATTCGFVQARFEELATGVLRRHADF